jgi:hypothetical protein
MYDPNAAGIDHNLVFGILALQSELLSADQFAEVCNEWATEKDLSLPRLLVQRGWLGPDGRAEVERLMERKLSKHGGDLRSCLAELTGNSLQQTLRSLTNSDLRLTLDRNGRADAGPMNDIAADHSDPSLREPLSGSVRAWAARHRVFLSSAAVIVVASLSALVIGVLMMPLAGQLHGMGPAEDRDASAALPRINRRLPPEGAAGEAGPDLLVRGLFDALVVKDDVIEHIRRDTSLTEQARKQHISVADAYPRDANQLNNASWFVVRQPGGSAEEYRYALRLAREAVRVAPGNGLILNSLGVAQYRADQFAEAVETLTESDRINSQTQRGNRLQGSLPADLAFLAMGYHRLGQKQKALEFLRRLQRAVERPGWILDPESHGFLREAETLILGKASTAEPTPAQRETVD